MNFFEFQDQARRKSHLLIGLFALAVVVILVAVYLVVIMALVGFGGDGAFLFEPWTFAATSLATLALIAGGSAFRSAQLRKGGPAVASLLGGRRVEPDTGERAERRLVNVVEEMSLAAGIPVPAIFVLDDEDSINAFAAGHGIHDAAVTVTRGTLDQLDRDELQGVVAHEFSHILNGDMRLNIRLVGLLFGILLLAVIGRGLLRGTAWSRRRKRDGRAVLVGLALVALGYLGVFFGKLIKAAVSRQREFLADAAAVQFTRNPEGLAGALKKIGAHPPGSRIRDHHAEELSHLFFADGLGASFTRLTATHPPLDRRIRRVDPAWDGRFPETATAVGAGSEDEPPASAGGSRSPATTSRTDRRALPGGLGEILAGGGPGEGSVAAAALLLGTAGSPSGHHVDRVREILQEVPSDVRDAVHDRTGAQAVVLALVGGRESEAEAVREEVLRRLDEGGEEAGSPAGRSDTEERPEAVRSLLDWAAAITVPILGLPPELRLPVLDLALPALSGLPEPRARELRRGVKEVIRADGHLRPFDFALVHILWRHVAGAEEGTRHGRTTLRSLSRARAEVETILSAAARVGAEDEPAAARAFRAGAAALENSEGALTLREEETVDLTGVDQALTRLEQGTMEIRRQVLTACATAVLEDREVTAEEVEFLRAVAEALEIPLPPLLPTSLSSRDEPAP